MDNSNEESTTKLLAEYRDAVKTLLHRLLDETEKSQRYVTEIEASIECIKRIVSVMESDPQRYAALLPIIKEYTLAASARTASTVSA